MDGLDAIVAHATTLRHVLHQRPELAHAEHDTAATIRGELDRLGILWRACGGTGTVADIGTGDDRVAFRADMDALPMDEVGTPPWHSEIPGRMHACGHDGHVACLLATAALLLADPPPRPVRLIFQPGEEGGHGAKQMIADGALDGVAEIYAFHSWPGLPQGHGLCAPGPLMGSNAEFNAHITGVGGHGAVPEACRNPLSAAARFAVQVEDLAPRALGDGVPGIVSVCSLHGGTAANVIPGTCLLGGTVRGRTTGDRDLLLAQVGIELTDVCTRAGCTAVFEPLPCYPATINDAACAGRAAGAFRAVAGDEALIAGVPLPLMIAEDFSYYLQERPGCYVLIGAGDGPACHHPAFDFDDGLIPLAARWYRELAS